MQGIGQGQRIHHRRQHAHVVGGGPLHAVRQAILAAPDVAGADHDGDFDAQLAQAADLAGDDVGLVRDRCRSRLRRPGLRHPASAGCDDSAARSSVVTQPPTSKRAKRRTTMFSPSLAIVAGDQVLDLHALILDEGLLQQAVSS